MFKKIKSLALSICFTLTSISSFINLSNKILIEDYYFDSFQHDGLYDSSIKNLYDSHRNVKGVALDQYYAPIYFRNLKNNIGNNFYGTCDFVAMSMLLSFWDTYWDDSIIPENYEIGPLFWDGVFTQDTDSPGIRKEFGPIFENLQGGYEDFKNLANIQWIRDSFYQIKLIDMWEDYLGDSIDRTMTIERMNGFLFKFFSTI